MSTFSGEEYEEKFWYRIRKSTNLKLCWMWQGPLNGRGYGHASGLVAHRIAYELSYGDIPVGLSVLHKCDTPLCCNPNHLFLGNSQTNAIDRANKKRGNICKIHNDFVSNGKGLRCCRPCKNMRQKKRRALNAHMA